MKKCSDTTYDMREAPRYHDNKKDVSSTVSPPLDGHECEAMDRQLGGNGTAGSSHVVRPKQNMVAQKRDSVRMTAPSFRGS